MKHQIFFFLYKVLGIGLCLSFWDATYFWWIMIGYLFVYLLVTSIGSYFIKYNWFIKSVSRNTSEGVTFTFDDGPHPIHTKLILEILKKYNVKATFFVIGKQAEKYPEILKEIHNQGHIIGNHSFSHSNYIPFFRSKKLIADFEKSKSIIEKIIGEKPNYIRPPFGATSPKYATMLKRVKVTSIGWTYRSFDTTISDPKELVSQTIKAIEKDNHSIMLFHDTMDVTVKSLEQILKQMTDNGFKFINLDESINQPPYE